MTLPKWTVKDLKWADSKGYKIVKCKDEQETLAFMQALKYARRCVQGGRIFDKDNNEVFFVITKHRGKVGKTGEKEA